MVAPAPPAPPPLTAEEAVRQAQAEGLTLQRSDSSTGFKGVYFMSRGKSKPYKVEVWRGGNLVYLGSYTTAEEAALSYARTPEVQEAAAAPPEPSPLTAEEALRQAEAEGLTLLRSKSSSTGYTGVRFNSSSKSKPYQAKVWRGGTVVHLGTFATAEEAALCHARTPEVQEAAAAPPAPQPLTAEEAVRQAEAEGLTLVRSESSRTGFKCVALTPKGSRSKNYTKPYKVEVRRGGKLVYLGSFATAGEAALCYARTPEAQATAPQLPAASSRKRKVRSEEQPPDGPADVVVILEGRLVESTTFE